MVEITHRSAVALAAGIRRRDVAVREVIDAHLERIAAVNPILNAVVQLAAESAHAEAAAADNALARDVVVGPLHGVPFTVKDWIETAGLVCAAGVVERSTFVPAEDATVVARMRAAGAILLGKTNVGLDNPVYGQTSNPYDASRTAAESSSGEAAIVAAGGSPLGLASDSGGSIRLPAHACGVVGLRPSNGRVPLTGHYPRINPLSDPRTAIGPMARRVEDLRVALTVIAGADGRDPSALPFGDDVMQAVDLTKLRIAFYTTDGVTEPTGETTAAVIDLAHALADHGLVVEERRPAALGDAVAITRAYWDRPESTSWDEWVPDAEVKLSSEDVERSLFEWDRFRRRMLGFMRDVDVIISPAAATPAVAHNAPEPGFSYLIPYSLTGWPSAVVRAGTSPDGLPIGVQIVAGALQDRIVLAVAELVEELTGGWQPPEL